MPPARRLSLPDLVILSMLAERPMHGYELWAELVRRHVWKWAGISRPQVYYSLNKLESRRLVAIAGDDDPTLGPERRVLAPTPAGRRGLADGLARSEWATQRPPPLPDMDGAFLAGASQGFRRTTRPAATISHRTTRGGPSGIGRRHCRDVADVRRGNDRTTGHSPVRGGAGLAGRSRRAPTPGLECPAAGAESARRRAKCSSRFLTNPGPPVNTKPYGL